MKHILHIAKAAIRRGRKQTASLFVIILIVSMVATIASSIMLGIDADYVNSLDRLGSLHSAFLMTKGMYKDSYEEIIQQDSRVSDYNILQAVYANQMTTEYGGKVDTGALFLNLDTPHAISAPMLVEQDTGISKEQAIYLPYYAKFIGYSLGDNYTLMYKNRPLLFTVAGFFQSNEMSTTNAYAIKYYVHDEMFESLSGQVGSSVWVAIRFYDPYDSIPFNQMFREKMDMEISSMGTDSFELRFDMNLDSNIMAIMSFASLVLGFALIITVISLMVIRFRVTNSIENNMHSIGVLKASGYTSREIIFSYLLEYGLVALPAALLGVFASIPLFSAIRHVLTSITGIVWTLGADIKMGILLALCIVLLLQGMVLLSCLRIRKLPPVVALRGGISVHNFRHNYFPLHKGFGNVQLRLGLKNIFAYGKLYTMIGFILAGIAVAITFMVATHQNFVQDSTAFIQMVGIEIADVTLSITPHTDAEALVKEIEKMPEVRKTSMLDWANLQIDGHAVSGFISNDFSKMETMSAFAGRFPLWENEVAMPQVLAELIGKEMGDTVSIKSSGVTQDYLICGFYSTTNQGGNVCAMTLEGVRRLTPNRKQDSINVYLDDGVTVQAFTQRLEQNFGVVNVYPVDETHPYAAAKARAEEKISSYLQQYNIDSVEYAVLYQGELIMSGSSKVYQIDKITDYAELIRTQIAAFGSAITVTTQFIAIISLIVVSLILSMTVRSIIAKRRRELGCLKAGGYTTRELAIQLGISFVPCAVVGTVVGCVGGSILLNPVFGMMFRSMGVKNATLVVNPMAVVLVGIGIIVIAVGVATLSAGRIKHISAYELLSE